MSCCFNLSITILVTFGCNQEQLAYLVDSQGKNLLMSAVEEANHDVAKELLKLPFDINHKTAAGHTAADIAWRQNKQKILHLLLKANSTFPKEFNKFMCINNDVKKFADTCDNVHAAIQSNNQEKVQKILEKNPGRRYFYDQSNVSAAAIAIRSKKLEMYELLVNNGCSVGPLENFNQIERKKIYFEGQDEQESPAAIKAKQGLERIHAKNSKKPPERHIMKHLSSLLYGHDELHPSQRMQHVREAFETLNTIPELSLTLKITALNRNIKNHFDFNRESVQHMVPTVSERTRGLFDPKGIIHVAAQKLTTGKKCEAIATLGHEHSHCAIHMTFGNCSEPYEVDDTVNEQRFKNIIEECRQMWENNPETMEPIVAWVFGYSKELWPAELIVRVPHMLAHYHGNETKLTELKVTFKSLFDYYRDVVMPAMKAALPVLEKSSEDSVKFSGLTDPLKAAILHSQVELQGVRVQLKEVANAEVLKLLTPQQIRKILEGKVIIKIGQKREEKPQEFYYERQFIGSEFKDDNIWRYNRESREYVLTAAAEAAVRKFDSVLADARESGLFLLSDHAGAGKSTTMRRFELKIKEELPDHWVCYIDLKRHVQVYEEFKNKKMDATSDIQAVLLQILSLPADGLESAVFTHLLNAGQVMLLLDGVDEIAPTYKEFFIRLITNIKAQTRNQQWIATRPHHTKELKEKLEHDAHKLLVFNNRQVVYFIRGFLVFKGYHKSEMNEEEEKHAQQLLKFCFITARRLKIMQNPLMLTMVAEMHAAGTLPTENFNRYSLYEAMVEHKMREIRADKGVVVNRDTDNKSKVHIWEVFRIYAMKLFFDDGKIEKTKYRFNYETKEVIELSLLPLFRMWQKEKSKWTADAISRGGLLIVDNFNTEDEFPDFNHRTFAEFFAAEFIVETVKEAIEDGDDMSEEEFEVRMELAIYFLRKGSDEFSSFYEILSFISDFVPPKMDGLMISKRFLEFLKQEKTQEIIQKLLLRIDKRKKIASTLILRFIKFSKFDQKLFNAAMVVKEGRSQLFRAAIKDSDADFCIGLFDIFKHSGIENWHRLTGFGLNLSEEQLQLPNDEELEKLVEVEILKFEMNVRFLKNTNALIDSKRDIARDFKLYYQFLCFVATVDDISDIADMVKLLRVFVSDVYFCFLTLTCSSITEKLFEIRQKHFQHHKADFSDLLREFGERFGRDCQRYFNNNDSEVDPVLDQFYTKVGEFFNPDDPQSRELIKRALTDKDGCILSLAVFTRSDTLSNLFQNSFDVVELIDQVVRAFIWNMDEYKHRRAEIVKHFDVFCVKTLNFPTIFELVLRHCSDLDDILKVVYDYKIASGYKPKSSNEGDSSTSSDEEFEYVRGNESESDEEKETRLLKNAVLCLPQLLCFINRHEIPLEHLEEFFDNNLGRILSCALMSGNDLVDKVIETLKLLKNSEKIVEIIKRGLGTIKIIEHKDFHTNLPQVLEYFCGKLDELVGGETILLDEVLKIIFESEKSNFFILAINNDWQKHLNIILEQMSVDEIVKTLLNSMKQIYKLREPNPENFESFLRKIMSDHRFVLVQNDFVRKSSDESDEDCELESKRSRIILQILTVIAQAEPPLTDLEEFFNEHFKIILDYSYRSRLMTEKVFEVLQKNFRENKTKVIEWIKKEVRESLYKCFINFIKSFTPEFRFCINNFWIKLEKFCVSDRELMRQFLIHENCAIHPLILSIYYDIESLQSFYLNYLETRELISIFANKLNFVFEIYDTKSCDESKKEELRTFKDKHGRTIFQLIDIKVKKLDDDYTYRDNSKELYKLLQKIAFENENNIK
jgi:ankyrin repeat protein